MTSLSKQIPGRSAILAAILALTALLAIPPVAGGQQRGAEEVERVLAGTIDIHVHGYPDNRPRSIDVMEAARLARSSGMRGIVLKNHYEPTGGLAYLIRKEVPGLEVFGGIALNLAVGGINPAAVDYLAEVSGGWGRFVWMPTFDSENQVRSGNLSRPFVSISRRGELLPEVKEVISRIAVHRLVLATGHSTPAEVLLLLQEGRRQGVESMVVTHAMNPPIRMDVSGMREAAALGAFIEFVGGFPVDAENAGRIDELAAGIRAAGVEASILSSDLGQVGNPLPAEGYAALLLALRARGFTDPELDLISRRNPARLLGLP